MKETMPSIEGTGPQIHQELNRILFRLIDENKLVSRRWSWVGVSGDFFFKIQKMTGNLETDFKNEDARRFIRNEYKYLLHLNRLDQDSVRPIALLDQHACLVMERVKGWDVFSRLRSGCGQSDAASAIEGGVKLLARLHKRSAGHLDGMKKFDYQGDRFFPAGESEMEEIQRHPLTITCGGFEIRNLIMEERTKRVRFFDPHHVYIGLPEDDLARFIISILMVNWGWSKSARVWDKFDFDQLLSVYEKERGAPLSKRLLAYCFNRNLAMREHFSSAGIGMKPIYKRGLARIYKSIYFRRIASWRSSNDI